MGCASSKSTPVIESNGNEDHVKGIMMNNEDTSDENMIQKGKDMMHNLKNDISGKFFSFLFFVFYST